MPPSLANSNFPGFVRTFATKRENCQPWYPVNHGESNARVRKLTGRISWLRECYETGDPDVIHVGWSAIEAILDAAIAQQQPLRTTLYNRSAIVGKVWTPTSRDDSAKSPAQNGRSVVRYFGGSTGLELNCGIPATVWLWTGQCNCCQGNRWALEVGDRDDELALALHGANPSNEEAWRDFVISTILA